MRFKALVAATALTAVTAAGTAFANPEEMEALTREMVLDAETYFNETPLDDVKAAFNDPASDRWVGDQYHLHMYGMDAEGVVWADSAFPDLVGMNSVDMADFDGNFYNQEVLAGTEGHSDPFTVNIRFSNPESGAIVDTVGTCLRPVQEHVICAWANDS